MNRFFSFCFAFIFIFSSSCFLSPPSSSTPSNSFWQIPNNQMRASLNQTVGIVRRNETRAFLCSGVFIHQDYILTAAHCFLFGGVFAPELDDTVHVVPYRNYMNSGYEESFVFQVVHMSSLHDLALLRRIDRISPDIEIVEMRQEPINLGEFVYTIGHPGGVPFNVNHGNISSSTTNWSTAPDTERLVSSTPVYHGNSGGPIFDSEGRLIGICSLMIGYRSHLNGAIHINSIRSFLREKQAADRI